MAWNGKIPLAEWIRRASHVHAAVLLIYVLIWFFPQLCGMCFLLLLLLFCCCYFCVCVFMIHSTFVKQTYWNSISWKRRLAPILLTRVAIRWLRRKMNRAPGVPNEFHRLYIFQCRQIYHQGNRSHCLPIRRKKERKEDRQQQKIIRIQVQMY